MHISLTNEVKRVLVEYQKHIVVERGVAAVRDVFRRIGRSPRLVSAELFKDFRRCARVSRVVQRC